MDTYTKGTFEYDPIRDTFTEKSSFPGEPREGGISFIYNGKAYVGLGEYKFQKFYSDLYTYNISTDKWSSAITHPLGKRSWASASTIGNKTYVGLGSNSSFTTYNDLWEFNGSVGIDEDMVESMDDISIYPNPSSSSFTIEWKPSIVNSPLELNFVLYDRIGCEVKKMIPIAIGIENQKINIERGTLSDGIYFYKITNNKETIHTGKLILE